MAAEGTEERKGRRREGGGGGRETDRGEERRAGPSWAALAERSICVWWRGTHAHPRVCARGERKCLRAAAAAAATRPAGSGYGYSSQQEREQRAGSRRWAGGHAWAWARRDEWVRVLVVWHAQAR